MFNPLLHRYSFQRINNRQLSKTLWEKKKLLVTSDFFFSHNIFYTIRKLYLHSSIFLTSYCYLRLNRKSPKLASEVKGNKKQFIDKELLGWWWYSSPLLIALIFPHNWVFFCCTGLLYISTYQTTSAWRCTWKTRFQQTKSYKSAMTINFGSIFCIMKYQTGLTLSQTTNFWLFQVERVCRRQFQIWQKLQKVLEKGRKYYGKRRNCLLWAISPFPTVFSRLVLFSKDL